MGQVERQQQLIDEINELEAGIRAREAPEGATALQLLQAVYRYPAQPLPVRIRCAVEARAYECPKLSAVAVASLTGKDFAAALDRAITRSGVKLIESSRAVTG